MHEGVSLRGHGLADQIADTQATLISSPHHPSPTIHALPHPHSHLSSNTRVSKNVALADLIAAASMMGAADAAKAFRYSLATTSSDTLLCVYVCVCVFTSVSTRRFSISPTFFAPGS